MGAEEDEDGEESETELDETLGEPPTTELEEEVGVLAVLESPSE